MRTLLAMSIGLLSPFVAHSIEHSQADAVAIQSRETPRVSITRHRGSFGGQSIEYEAVAAETFIPAATGKIGASLFSVSYIRRAVKDPATRPVTFLFNGGPGSSSVYLHLGGLGPRRVVIPSDTEAPGVAPYRLVHNPDCILDVTDLVFIDPVNTGYSRVVDGKLDDYQSIDGDAHSVVDLIKQWLTAHHRWNSPKYLAGESYGSHRAAAVVREFGLPDQPETIVFNGVILLGQALDFTETRQVPGNDTPYVIYLPTYAAIAWYHGKVDRTGRTFETFVKDAQQFARTDYLQALYRGSDLPASEKSRIATRVAQFSGLSAELVEHDDLRVTTARFAEKLLDDQGRTLKDTDGRYAMPAIEAINRYSPGYLPPGVEEAYTIGIHAYLESDLQVHYGESYLLSVSPQHWDFALPDGSNHYQNYLNLAPYIANAMRANRSMRLFIGSGYYDLQAAFSSAERTVSHNGFPRDRVTVRHYESGHMIYLQPAGAAALNADLRAFIRH